MEYRKLGTTDIEVSVMALGCWPFAGGKVWGEQNVSQRVGAPLASVALAWVLKQRGVTSLLVGARNPDELARNLPALALDL